MTFLAKNAKALAFIGIILGGLVVLGNIINIYVDPNLTIMTNIFVIFRKSLGIIDFAIDTDTLLQLIGYSLIILVAYWGFKAILFLVDYLNKKD